MAARSPCPNLSRSSNPNPKTSEIRRSGSFTGGLSKHSISSEENHQRSSGSKPGKENGRVKTPAGTGSLKAGTKSFMAPTISASSKAVAASPRKRILGERNEEIGEKAEILEGGFEPRSGDPEIKKQEVLVVPKFPLSPVVAPIDEDPYLPPYDPKTNYLSPRPRFLHYKPNPRIEQYLFNKEAGCSDEIGGEGRRLEDSFFSESLEDTSGDEQSSELQKDSEEGEEEEQSSFVELDAKEEEVKVEAEIKSTELKSQPETITASAKTGSSWRFKLAPFLSVLLIACFCLPFLDSPAISYSSMVNDRSFAKIYAPAIQVFEELNMRDHLNEMAAVANVNVEELASRFSHWLANAIAYFSSLISLQREEGFGLFHPANLTASAADDMADFIYIGSKTSHKRQGVEEAVKELDIDRNMEEEEHENGMEIEIEASQGSKQDEIVEEGDADHEIEHEIVEEGDADHEIEHEIVEEGDADHEIEHEIVEEGDPDDEIEHEILDESHDHESQMMEMDVLGLELNDIEAEAAEHEILEESADHESQKMGMKVLGVDLNNIEAEAVEEMEAFLVPEEDGVPDASEMVVKVEEYHGLIEKVKEEESSPGLDFDKKPSVSSSKLQEFLNRGNGLSFAMHTVLGISAAAIAVAGSIVVLYMNQRKTASAIETGKVAKPAAAYPVVHLHRVQQFSQEVDMIGDSDSLEVSSSFNYSSPFCRQRPKQLKAEEEEASQSHERSMRRDSAASSSISYGSFTAYERLSAKKGSKDEGAVTPVRRSSRIRNQLASP